MTVASIHALSDRIVHLRLEDVLGCILCHLPFGEGDLVLAAVRQALHNMGYGGPYVAARALADIRRLFGE